MSARAVKALLHKRLMTHSELIRYGTNGVQLRRLSETGQMISLGSGIYASPRLEPFVASVLAASKYYPQTVISGLTAMQIHGLSQEYIDRIDVDIPRETSLRNALLRVHRVPKSRMTGIVQMKYQGGMIRIYDLERTLCEAYKLDPAGPLFFKSLKRYLKLGKIKSEQIAAYDKTLKTRVLMHLQQELADG